MGAQNYAVVATVIGELGEANDKGIKGYLKKKLPILEGDSNGDKGLFTTLTKDLKDLVPEMLKEMIISAAEPILVAVVELCRTKLSSHLLPN